MNIRLIVALIPALGLAACAAPPPPVTVVITVPPIVITSPPRIITATPPLPGETTVEVITAEAGTAGVATAGPAITVNPQFGTPQPFPTPLPPTPIPPLPGGGSPTDLKYVLLAAYPDFFYCDPDEYPVARGDEQQIAIERFPQLQANQEEFASILRHNNLSGVTQFSNAQKLLIYRDHKKLAAILFEAAGNAYQFQLRTGSFGGKGVAITGLIDAQGAITIISQQPSFTECPICLAAHTLIATPNGPVAVEDLQIGDMVWTLNTAGKRIAAPLVKVGSAPVPAGHLMVHLTLADGRQLWASPGHPTADGRRLGDLAARDMLDGARVVSAGRAVYDQPATFDVLPAGGTGFYWANGILVGSTLVGP